VKPLISISKNPTNSKILILSRTINAHLKPTNTTAEASKLLRL